MNKDFIVSNLIKQKSRLEDLIQELEGKSNLEPVDFRMYDEISRRVEKDLKALRKEGALCIERDLHPYS